MVPPTYATSLNKRPGANIISTPGLARFGRNGAEFGRSRRGAWGQSNPRLVTNASPSWSMRGQVWPTWVEFAPKFGRVRARSGRSRPQNARVWPEIARNGPVWVEVAPKLIDIGPVWAPDRAADRATSSTEVRWDSVNVGRRCHGRTGPNRARLQPKLDLGSRLRADPAESPTLADVRVARARAEHFVAARSTL